MKSTLIASFTLALATACTSAGVTSSQHEGIPDRSVLPMTLESTFVVPPELVEEFVQHIEAMNAPVLHRLVEQGSVAAWGLREAFTHGPGGHDTYSLWISLPHTDELDTVLQEVDAHHATYSEEHPEVMRIVDAGLDLSLHASSLQRDLFFETGTPLQRWPEDKLPPQEPEE